MKAKTVKRYQVRYECPTGHFHTRPVGFKERLIERRKALKIIKRLRKTGVDAYLSSPIEIKVFT